MKHRDLNLHLAAVLLLISNLVVAGGNAPQKPNILLIVSDDIGIGDLAQFGSEIKPPMLETQEPERFESMMALYRSYEKQHAIVSVEED